MFGLFKKSAPATAVAPQLRADQLQPRIKHIDFANALEQAGLPHEQLPAMTALCCGPGAGAVCPFAAARPEPAQRHRFPGQAQSARAGRCVGSTVPGA